MTLRLDALVTRGELDCSGYYSVTGWLELDTSERVLHLQLTGRADADLHGWRIRFAARKPAASPSAPSPIDFDALHWQQVGPTGQVRYERDGERRLVLEWSGQDGPTSVVLINPQVEFLEHAEEKHVPVSDPIRLPEDELSLPPEGEQRGPEPDSPGWDEANGVRADDPYGLFPEDLERQLSEESADEVPADEPEPAPDEEGPSRVIQEAELIDALIERGPGEIIGTLFETPLRLPRPDDLDDEGAEKALKTVLAQMALWGIQLHLCAHFTPRDAYRLVVEHICRQGRSYPELRRTQWVQSFTTAEYCRACEADLEREFEEWERRRAEEEGPPFTDEDLPWDEGIDRGPSP